MKIRRAKEKDAEQISSLIHEAFLPFKAAYTDDAFEYTTPGPEVIRDRFAEGPIWVVENDGVLFGTVSGLPDGERFYVRSMAVKPGMQRGGVGQTLLDAIETFASEVGFSRIYLYTTFVLPAARPLYEKNGYRVVRETPPEEWFDMGGIEMEKEI